MAATLGVSPADLWLLSCHAFDTLGAAAADNRTARILRTLYAPVALVSQPDLVATDLGEIVAGIAAAGAWR